MQSCLGVYIEDNLIKYAKVQKDRDNLKVEAFGTKFYENLQQAIDQIVAETNSRKIPISINISDEYYDYFSYFALLNKSALKKSIDIDFEMLCAEKGTNKDNIERKNIFVLDPDDTQKMKAINVSIERQNLSSRKALFEKYNLATMEPLPIGIMNLVKLDNNANELIVNMEEKTTLTFCANGQIDKIDEINTSIIETIKEISKLENSQTKAYEILKNTTISSQEFDMFQDGNEYMDTIVPVLFKITNEIKEKINEYGRQINKIYFTGTGIVINNIDMYFQDRINIQCELVKPSFLDSQSLKIGIKDYIEVNSAISLALSGLQSGNELNFATKGKLNIQGLEITGLPKRNVKSLKGTTDEKLDAIEKLIVRILILAIICIIIYSTLTTRLYKNMEQKISDTDQKTSDTTASIEKMKKTKTSVEYLTSEYESLISKLNNESLQNGENVYRTDEINNFLTKLKTIIPTEVKLISVENTQERHFVIQARAIKYQQLGYFKALLETPTSEGTSYKAILENVKASTGIRYHDETADEDYILVTIEGDLTE
jgi:hypothetical protein